MFDSVDSTILLTHSFVVDSFMPCQPISVGKHDSMDLVHLLLTLTYLRVWFMNGPTDLSGFVTYGWTDEVVE